MLTLLVTTQPAAAVKERHALPSFIAAVQRRAVFHPSYIRRAPHEVTTLGAEGQQLVVPTLPAAQPQEAMRQDAALEEGLELALDETQ